MNRTAPVTLTAWTLLAWAVTSVSALLAYTHYSLQRAMAPDYPAKIAAEARMLDLSRLQAASEAVTLGLTALAAVWIGQRLRDGEQRWTAWAAAMCFAGVGGIWLGAWLDVLPADVRWLGTPRLALIGLGWLFAIELTAQLAAQRGVRLAYGIAAVAAAMVLWRFGLGAVYAHTGGPRMGEFRPWLWTLARAVSQGAPALLLVWLALRRRSSSPQPSPSRAAERAAWTAVAWFAVGAAAQAQQLFPSLRFPSAWRVALVAGAMGIISAVRAYRLRPDTSSRGSKDHARTRDGES